MPFYCDGLGCQPAERYELDGSQLPGLAEALEVAGPVTIVSQMITHGGLKIELIEWRNPHPAGEPASRRNHLGLTHLSFVVDDVDVASRRLIELGGEVLPSTRQRPGIDLVFVADPDGTRVELMGRI